MGDSSWCGREGLIVRKWRKEGALDQYLICSSRNDSLCGGAWLMLAMAMLLLMDLIDPEHGIVDRFKQQ